MMTPFAGRVQQFSVMTDEELRNTLQQMSYDSAKMHLANDMANSSMKAAQTAKSQISSLAAAQASNRAKLASTPWYRPFKRASLKASMASTSTQIAAAKKSFAANNYASVLATKHVVQAQTPQMKMSSLIMREISQTLEVRAQERARLMAADLRMRKQVQAARERQAQLKHDNPSLAMTMVELMTEELKEHERDQLEIADEQLESALEERADRNERGMRRVQVERERPRY